jgi:Ca2+-binding RTX toxin-like protein
VTATAVEAGATCQGQPATLVGVPGTKLTGTAGQDVIVTAGAREVRASGGHDLICVTRGTQSVYAGNGNDHVTTDDWVTRTWIYLEDGTDTIVGGGRADLVYTGPGTDRVETGPGDDFYGYGGGEGADTVELGPGDDAATILDAKPDAPIDGGTGFNSMTIEASSEVGSESWVVDNLTETMTVDGVAWLSWHRFAGFSFPAYAVEGRVDFIGSDADERVTASQEFEFGPEIGFWDLGGGDDEAVFDGLVGPVKGGPGSDWVRLVGFADERSGGLDPRIAINLRRNRMHMGAGDPAFRIPGVENAQVSDFVVSTLRGDDQDNELIVGRTCLARLFGRAGDDVLRGSNRHGCSARTAEFFDVARAVRAYGEAGDDTMVGRGTPDVLVGDIGYDLANGRRGDDVCSAEYRQACERRP